MPEQSNGSSRRFQRPPVVEENKSPDEGHVQVGRFAVSPPLDAEFDPLPLHKRCSATIEASTRSRKHLTESYQGLGVLIADLLERNQLLCDENARLHTELLMLKIRRRSVDSPTSCKADSTPSNN